MARFRLSRLAQADVVDILAQSEGRWGIEARRRYQSVLAEAMRQTADDPNGTLTRARNELQGGPRSYHVRHTHIVGGLPRVRNPVLYYRPVRPGLIEIMRVLHDRMEPALHFTTKDPE